MKRSPGSFIVLAFWTAVIFPVFVFGAEIVLKKKPEKSLQAKVIAVTDKAVTVETSFLLKDVRSINGVVGVDPARIRALAQAGRALIDDQKYDEAIALLIKVSEMDPHNAVIFSDIADAMNRAQRYTEALPYALKGVEMDPSSGDAWRRLGDAYRHDKTKEKDAVSAYERAIRLQGPNPVNQFDMGVTYECYKKCAQGLPFLERALTMDPSSKEIRWYFYTHLGRCYLALGRTQDAITAFQKVLEKFPVSEQGKAYHWLGVAYKSLGLDVKASECEQRAKEIWDANKTGKK